VSLPLFADSLFTARSGHLSPGPGLASAPRALVRRTYATRQPVGSELAGRRRFCTSPPATWIARGLFVLCPSPRGQSIPRLVRC